MTCNSIISLDSKASPGESYRQSSVFRSDIEGLRGIAILLVVLFHCGISEISGGFVGVDVFFVLSGFLITGMLVNEVQKTSKLNLAQFYARRARRLLPAFTFTIVVTLMIGGMLLTPDELYWAGRAGQAAAFYMSNLFFDINAGNYFGPDVQSNPLLHTWSLAIEEQFYLFWPLLILIAFRWWKSKKALVVMLSGVTLISFGIGFGFSIKGGTFAFYELPARAWEFGVGGLARLFAPRQPKIPGGWWSTIGWLGLLMILGTAHILSINGETSFPGWVALIPTMGVAAVLITGTQYPHCGVGVLLAVSPLQVLGRLSYSWYLWHWPFLVFSVAIFPTISVGGKLAAVGLAFIVASISYYIVEYPIRFHPSLLRRPALSIGIAGGLTVFSLGAAFVSLGIAASLAKQPQMSTIMAAIGDISRLPRNECVGLGQSAEVKVCQFGNKSSEINIVLFGDSHAVQWFNPLEKIANINGLKLTTVVKSACPAFDIKQFGRRTGDSAACSQWRADAIAKIMALRPTLVFLGNSTSYLGRKDTANVEHTLSLNDLREGTRRTLEALGGLQLVIMRDTPSFSFDVPKCLAKSTRNSWYPNASCESDKSTALNPAVFESEQAGARGLPNIHFIDITDNICQTDTCKPIQGQVVIYRDKHHLTGQFADSLTAALAQALHNVVDSRVQTQLSHQ